MTINIFSPGDHGSVVQGAAQDVAAAARPAPGTVQDVAAAAQPAAGVARDALEMLGGGLVAATGTAPSRAPAHESAGRRGVARHDVPRRHAAGSASGAPGARDGPSRGARAPSTDVASALGEAAARALGEGATSRDPAAPARAGPPAGAWEWNWTWGGQCPTSTPAPSAAAWTWNWTWGCEDGGDRARAGGRGRVAVAPDGLSSELAEAVAAATAKLPREALRALAAPAGAGRAASARGGRELLAAVLPARAAPDQGPARRKRAARGAGAASPAPAASLLGAGRRELSGPAATAPVARGTEQAGAARARDARRASAARSRQASRRTRGGHSGGDRGGGSSPPRDAPAPPPAMPPGAAGASGSSGGPASAAGLMAALVAALPLAFPSFFTRLAGAAVARRQEPAGPRLDRPG